MVEIILVVIGCLVFLIFSYASFISVKENETKAARKFLLSALALTLPFLLLGFIDPGGIQFLKWLSVFLIVLVSGILLIPLRPGHDHGRITPVKRVDERDIMFSRNDLVPGTSFYNDYYERNPRNKKNDDKFRANPGLLNPGSLHYNPFAFTSAIASFDTVEQLHALVEGKEKPEKIHVKPDVISAYLKEWGKKLGALNVGITGLKDYHQYSIGGRRERYGKEIRNRHQYAVALTVEMEHTMMASAPAAPTIMESAQQYLSSGMIAVQIARFIRQLGYPARAHIDANYEIICPIVARDAGLGEIGRMGLLMTPYQGPRVRISVITTDMPLITDKPFHEPAILNFCKNCKKCAEVCPSQAISFNTRELIDGIPRWKINSEACYTYWSIAGTDCGRCITVCPYSHPDNALHNLVRKGIKNSTLFSKMALRLDDFFYGRKPTPKDNPEWIPSD